MTSAGGIWRSKFYSLFCLSPQSFLTLSFCVLACSLCDLLFTSISFSVSLYPIVAFGLQEAAIDADYRGLEQLLRETKVNEHDERRWERTRKGSLRLDAESIETRV